MSNKHNTYASYYFPDVKAYFVANPSVYTGSHIVNGKDGDLEEDYSGPVSVETVLPNYVGWNAVTSTNDHYWTSLEYTSSQAEDKLEILNAAAHYPSEGLDWKFSAPFESFDCLDIVPGCSTELGAFAHDNGFYHIGKVTGTYIQKELDNFGIY